MKNFPPELKGKKASDTFLEYVEPYLKHIMSDGSICTKWQVEIALRIPWWVWNAIVMDKKNNKSENEFMNLLKSHMPPHGAAKMIEDLIERKEKHFSQYNYLFGEYSVYVDENDELGFRMESRLPP